MVRSASKDNKKLFEELMDTEQLGNRGEGYFLAQGVLMALVVLPPAGLKHIVDVAGAGLFLLAMATIVAGSLSLGDNLTPLPKPREEHSLVTDGMYQYMRHPMYGGVILAALGLGVFTGDETRLALAALLFVVLDKKSSYEETFLVEKYGNQYEAYRSKVKKLIPWVY